MLSGQHSGYGLIESKFNNSFIFSQLFESNLDSIYNLIIKFYQDSKHG